jgi:hypothetical protein
MTELEFTHFLLKQLNQSITKTNKQMKAIYFVISAMLLMVAVAHLILVLTLDRNIPVEYAQGIRHFHCAGYSALGSIAFFFIGLADQWRERANENDRRYFN